MRQDDEPSSKDHPDVIAPPPVIFGGILLLTLALDLIVGGPDFGLPSKPQMTIGLILSMTGFVIIAIAAFQFRAVDTPLEPWMPTTAIVTTGLYALSRNPVYVGMAVGYLGLSLLSDRLMTLAGLPAALVIVHYGVILREEHYLAVKFGEAYRAYKRRVRRWV